MLKFFGHIIRVNSIEKAVIQGIVQGKRQIGRPPIRFIDRIKSVVTVLRKKLCASPRTEISYGENFLQNHRFGSRRSESSTQFGWSAPGVQPILLVPI